MRWEWTDRRIARLIALVLIAPIGYRAATWLRPVPKIVVARDTTDLTEPLDEDGMVDYERAWREERSRGVTAENNAAPLVFAAAGLDTQQFSQAERAQLPEVAAAFRPFDGWGSAHAGDFAATVKAGSDLVREAFAAMERGETGSPAARVAFRWLDEFSPALALVERAVERDRFFVPTAWSRECGDAWALRELSNGLRWRAVRAMALGDTDAACADLRAGMRLARFEAEVGVVNFLLVGFEAEKSLALAALIQARRAGRFPAAGLRALIDADDPSGVEPRIREFRRFSRRRTLELLSGLPREGADLSPAFKWSGALISRLDPNVVLRRQNRWFDRELEILLADAAWEERLRRLSDFRDELLETRRSAERWHAPQLVWRSPDTAGRILFDAHFLDPAEVPAYVIRPLLWTDRALIELAALVFATENGRDPAASDELTPSIFATPWRDRVTGSAVAFHRDRDGWLVADGPVVELLPKIDAAASPRRATTPSK